MLIRAVGATPDCTPLEATLTACWLYWPAAGSVADVVLMPTSSFVMVAPVPAVKLQNPCTSQSPAVKLMLVRLSSVEFVKETAENDAVTYSPIDPALALLFVGVPAMPFSDETVSRPVTLRVVNAPAAGVVPPMAGGVANARLALSHGVAPLNVGRTENV